MFVDLVRGAAASILGRPDPGTIDPAEPFKDLGFDSLAAVELRNRISHVTGLRLPATVTFDYPTPLALVDHLQDTIRPAEAGPASTLGAALDRLEEDLSAIPAAAPERAVVRARLHDLLWKLDGRGREPEKESEYATDEELFAVLDNELGSAPGHW